MKTESAIGITIRAIQNGDKVLYTQFLKDGTGLEMKYFSTIDSVTTLDSHVDKITLPKNITIVDRFRAQVLFSEVDEEMHNGYKLVVLDEILPALDMGLLTLEQVKDLVDKCNELEVDLYMTGRVRSKGLRFKIAEISDTCTDAHCIKHSFNTYCKACSKEYKYHYTYCPDCGSQLTKSSPAKKGRDF